MKTLARRSSLAIVALLALSSVGVVQASVAPPTTSIGALRLADDSNPGAGFFHLVGPTVPDGTELIRYRNPVKSIQVGLVPHEPGPLDLWFRAPGALGSTVDVVIEALDDAGEVITSFGTVTLLTGDRLLPLPENSGAGRRMVVDITAQQVWLVESNGRVSSTFLMSGRRRPTESGYELRGQFKVYSKSDRFWAPGGSSGRLMVRYQRTASHVGSHAIPAFRGQLVQSVDDLGWPLSDGCARLKFADAKRVYDWTRLGTTVVVVGR